MKTEFKSSDIIVQIGHSAKCTVESVGQGHYFVKWIGGGDSMLRIEEVDRDYVKVGSIMQFEFQIGDKIIRIGGDVVYDVLRCFNDHYEIMGNDYMHVAYIYDRQYVEDNFVLISTLRGTDDE